MPLSINNGLYNAIIDQDFRLRDLQVTGTLQVDGALNPTGLVSAAAGVKMPTTVISGDGAITISPGIIALTKGTAAAITIAAPTAVTHDGYLIWVYTETAAAHVITCATVGFNLKGSSGTVTFTAAIGNAVLLCARNGNWIALTKTGVTLA
jgi:hypothetical protein